MKSLFYFLMLFTEIAFAQDLKIMSYNIRLEIESDGNNQWKNRNEFLTKQVLFYAPDFLGVQEALPAQLEFMDKAFVDYAYIGKGRDDGKSKGEHSAIFYNTQKIKLLEENTFWLSATPEKPTKGWDASYNRVCTYGLFEILHTKQKIWVFNTHLDHMGEIAKNEGVKLILSKIKQANISNLPVILTGDFNLEPETQPIKTIETQFDNTHTKAKLSFGPKGTFNGFEFHKPVNARIDYIFVSKKGILVTKFATLTDSADCRYPSDHFPVYAEINFIDN